MKFDTLRYNYQSRRNVVYAKKGMVATGQPLASQAGLDILKEGGNAIDAAIATAAALTVLEPTCNGIGGDNFALVWTDGKLHGMNSSGPAPKAISLEALKDRGITEMPEHGLVPVTVPGAPAGWVELSKRFGKLPLEEVLKPAIKYATEGYPVSPTVAKLWADAFNKYKDVLKGEEYESWFKTFTPNMRPPRPGEIWKSEDHARTLKLIAQSNGEAFYKGELAERIDEFSRKYDGFLRLDDLAEFHPEWVDPININYRGYDVWEIPPNGHGIVALMTLNILKGFDFEDKQSTEAFHKQIEAMKLAYMDGKTYVADPRAMKVTSQDLLSEEYAALRRDLIGKNAITPSPGKPNGGGTVYLATADEDGNMVSMIQSNYMGFGSGLVVPGTGIALHNRGHNFSLDSNHHNVLRPGMKPYHTIIPGFLTKDDKAVGPFGVMGGFMQPQGHVQVIINTIDYHMNPQEALDAYRWQWTEDKTVLVEAEFPDDIVKELINLGHNIVRKADYETFGRGQIIWRDEAGVFCGGTEKRTDGSIAAW